MVFGRAIPVRQRIGRTPAEEDVGTGNAPRAPPHASLPTQPDEGRDPALGESVAAADRSRQQTAANPACSPQSRPIAIAISPRPGRGTPNAIVAPARAA
jgi:hypothetical protein